MTEVVGPVVQILISRLQQEFNLIQGIEKDVEKLTRTLSTIQDVLQDAETQQLQNRSITNWLKDLKNAAYKAEDLLEEWSIEEAQRSGHEFTHMGCASKVSHFISTSVNFNININFRHKMASKLKELLSTFDDIAEQKNKFHLNVVVVPHAEPQIDKNRVTTSKIIEPRIYGRDEDKKNVTDILLNNVGGPEDVSICPIVGFGGVGKTTLAQSVYNDERVVRCFEVRIWVCVSEPFDIERVLKAIIEAFEKKPCDLKTLEPIQSKVGDILRDKRYLLVLDDVWNENQDEWNKLKGFLNCGAKGSSIILTTRLERVASITGARTIYRLGILSDDDCWSLLKYRALGDRSEDEHPNLVKIGRDIVKKCKGVPLAAKSLGSLLGSKIDEKHWELVRDSEIWNFEEGGENSILRALRLSYNHLPPHLKQCFSYCSIFPKDHEMGKNTLIRLWIANGFLQSQGRKELEEVGDDAFNDLLWLSFFQDTEEDEYGNVITFKMHDLMHDLACSVAVDECLITKLSETKNVSKTIRHLSLIFNSSQPSISVEALVRSQPSLRTLIYFGIPKAPPTKFPTTLRVLNLSKMGINTLPPSIRHLKHLRYLDISFNSFKSLPESICDLRNLQSLVLADCYNLRALPENMRNMSSLRHLYLCQCGNIRKMPVGFGKLKCLQTLHYFVVGVPDRCGGIFGNDRCGGIKELQGLNQLRELWIIRLGNVRNSEDAKEANLKDKQYLTELELWFDGDSNEDKVLEGLGLPPNLQKLTINWYRWATYFPQGFLQNVNALKSLVIGVCDKLKSLPAEMKNLTALTSLSIKYCLDLILSDENFQHLTSLQHLELWGLPKLRALPKGIQHLTMLRKLEIGHCNNLAMLPEWLQHLTALQHLEVYGCHSDLKRRCEKEKGEDWHIISHIRYLDIDSPPPEEEKEKEGSTSEESSTSVVT